MVGGDSMESVSLSAQFRATPKVHSVRFDAIDATGPIKTLYISHEALKPLVPAHGLKVTIQVVVGPAE